MSANATRRNGKAASCEPCRKGKIRCDHKRPICSRCERRGIASRCIYHPAPLTKARVAATSPSSVAFPITEQAAATTNVDPAESSFEASHRQSNAFSFAFPPTSRRQADDNVTQDKRVTAVVAMLAMLQHCSLMQMLVLEYTLHAQAALVPGPIAIAFVNSLPTTIASYSLDDPARNHDGLAALAKDVLHATAQPVVINSQTSVNAFISQFTGSNLRLHTLALVYALTARSCLLGLARDDEKRDDLMQTLARSSSACIRLARDINPDMDDVSIWAAFEDARLSTHLDGDSSPRVYRRIGELATDMYLLGIHRESAITFDTPYFIAECRRKTFVAAYQLDKFIATLLDRPPRILRRYSDCKIPLDLSDEELLSCISEDDASLLVSSSGWNTKANYIPATWQRLRFSLGSFREEILEYRLRPSNRSNNAELRSLLQRCQRFVESLPDHLRYRSDCWESDLSTPVCLMLTSMHLNILQGDFQIHRLLEISDPSSTPDLLCVAAETIATLIQIGTHLNKAVFLRHDFPYLALTYGLPTASRLAAALQGNAQTDSSPTLPIGLSRSTIIRNLSVYISYLESVFSPADGNYETCKQAAKSLSRILDDILNAPRSSHPVTPMSTDSNIVSGQTVVDVPTQDILFDVDAFGMADQDIFNGGGLEGFDLANWAKSIDWTSGSWNTT